MRIAPVLLTLLLAGCSAAVDEPGPAEPSPGRVTDPSEYGYLDDPNTTGRPHVHDYWDGQTTHVVVEDTFRMGEGPTCSGRSYTVEDHHPGWIVRPGTRWLNVTVEWTSDWGPGTLELHWSSLNSSKSNRTELENGITYTVNTTEDMNDLPHSQTTRWSLWLAFRDDDAIGCPAADVSLRVEIARPPGPLPLAPPHPDFWGQNDTIILHDSHGELDDAPWSMQRSRPPTLAALDRAPHIIPPQTERVQVRLWYNSSTDPELHYDPSLDWWGADHRTREEAREPIEARRDNEGYFLWEIDAEPTQWDSPYDNRTAWRLAPEWIKPVYGIVQEPYHMDGDYHFQVRIHRQP